VAAVGREMAACRENRTGGRVNMLTAQRKIHRLAWLLLTPLLLILIAFAARPGAELHPANAANTANAANAANAASLPGTGAPDGILP